LAETHGSIGSTRDELEASGEELQEITGEIEQPDEAFRAAEQDCNQATEQYNQLNLQFSRHQRRRDGLRQELSFRSNQHQDLQAQITSNTASLKDATEQLTATETVLNSGDTELYDLMKQKETDEASLNEKDRLYYELRNEISEKEGTLNQKRREKEQAETLLNSIKDKLNEMKLQLAGMKERLSVEFKVNLDEVLDQDRTGELTVDELNAEAE